VSEGKKNVKRAVNAKIKITGMVLLLIVLFLFLAVRLTVIAVVDHKKYSELATSQQVRDMEITPKRGTIYDTNMNVLAESAVCWTVAISPDDIGDDAEKVAEFLGELLDIDSESIVEKSKEGGKYSRIMRKVDEPTAAKIREFAKTEKIGGIILEEDSKRYYPYGNFASHILGFVGTDNYGLAGLEASYNSVLSGTSGRIITAQNAVGSEMYYQYESVYNPVEGQNLVLTIDEVIQHYLESALETAVKEHHVANRATGIIMDVNTGAILGMATKGDFDPNNPFEIIDPVVLERLEKIENEEEREKAYYAEQEKQWNNKAIGEIYEPGSVYKVITAATALETNSVSMDSTFYCGGSIEVIEGTTMYCAIMAHGMQTFPECLVNSCNPGFIQIGQRIGRQNFWEYFKAFGFSEKTGIDLPGETDSVYYTADQMGIVELASVSYGQSNSITPIQMITAFSATVNGGYLVTPHVVRQIIDNDGNVIENIGGEIKRQVISRETSDRMRLMLEDVVTGFGSRNAYVSGFRIGGKSGTSQKLSSENERAFVASFCVFAPVDDPQIACLVLLDEANSYSIYGTALVGPVVANIMSNTLPYLGVEPSYTEEELLTVDVGVPNVVGMSLTMAYDQMQKKGLKFEVVGDGTSVTEQSPKGGFAAPRGTVVYLYTGDETPQFVDMPDLSNMSPSNAVSTLKSYGLNVRMTGPDNSGSIVVYQSHDPGEKVLTGTVITIEVVDSTGRD